MKKLIILISILTGYTGTVYTQVIAQDSLALVDLYNSLNGPSWTSQNNWLTGPVKTWWGISLNYPDSNRVSAINMEGNNISGHIPNSIGDLTELIHFKITSSNLGGNFPHTIGRLKKCRNLTFYNNNMSGQLTDSIGGMTDLQCLDISINQFSGNIPTCLSYLAYFHYLSFGYNNIENLPNFSQVPQFNYFHVFAFNNNLTFEDLEYNMQYYNNCIPACIPNYAPQFDSVNISIDTTVQEQTFYEIHCSIGGQYNQYQWTKDGVDIPSATNSVLIFSSIALGDSGVYSCRITNSIVPGLTYHRRSVALRVDNATTTPASSKTMVNEMLLYPSPASDYLNIAVKLKETEHATIELFDIYGNKIKTIANTAIEEAVLSVNVSNLAKGAYIIRLTSNGFTSSQRFLIIK